MAPFRIAINMAGAVSAGAYTAGVLDFLIQALDQGHEAKARGDLVPGNDVCIEVMSGAFAGGMCAAIAGRRTVPENLGNDLCGKAAERLMAAGKALTDGSSWGLRTRIGLAAFVFKGKPKDAIQAYVMQNLGSAVQRGK